MAEFSSRLAGRRLTWAVWRGSACLMGVLLASRVGAQEPRVSINGYLQPQFILGIGDDAEADRFAVRRMRAGLDAEPTNGVRARIEVDFGEGSAQLTHGYVEFVLPALLVGEGRVGDWRVRVGQIKMPLAVDTPRSSTRQLALEGLEAARCINPGAWDQGLFILYTPPLMRDRFRRLQGDYGVGDAGMISLGLINGQGRNQVEADHNKPFVLRVDYPFTFRLGEQERIGQVGLSGRYGQFTNGGDASRGIDRTTVSDHATVLHVFTPPEPWGVEAEWIMAGKGPALNATGTAITTADLDGFGAQASYCRERNVVFLRYDEMNGWRKRVDRLPTQNNFNRWSLGWVYRIQGLNRITVEYDFIDRNGNDEDQLGIQWQVVY